MMAKYGQTPADLVVSDDEDEKEIQEADGESFSTHDAENTHWYATKRVKNHIRRSFAQNQNPRLSSWRDSPREQGEILGLSFTPPG